MRQTRIFKTKTRTAPRRDQDEPDLRTPSGRLLPF
jgi:hypothetical protein